MQLTMSLPEVMHNLLLAYSLFGPERERFRLIVAFRKVSVSDAFGSRTVEFKPRTRFNGMLIIAFLYRHFFTSFSPNVCFPAAEKVSDSIVLVAQCSSFPVDHLDNRIWSSFFLLPG